MLGVYKQLTTCRDQLNDKSDGPEVTGDMTLFINGYTSWVPMCAKLVESRQWGSSGVWLRDAEPVYRCRRNTWKAESAKWRNLNALLQSAGSNSSQRWALKFLQRCERTSYKQKNKKNKNGSAENVLIPVCQILCRQVESQKPKHFFILQKALFSKAISGLTEAK